MTSPKNDRATSNASQQPSSTRRGSRKNGSGSAAIVAAIDNAQPLDGGDVAQLPSRLNRDLAWYPCNDTGNAQRLIDRFGEDLAYIHGEGWAVWDGKRWDLSADDDAVKARAQLVAAAIRDEADALPAAKVARKETLDKWANTSGNEARIKGMISQARPHLRRNIGEFDANPMIMNVQNGVLLFNGGDFELVPHDRKYNCTKIANVSYDPLAEAPEWGEFTEQVLPETEKLDFIRRWFGYSSTGDTSQQCMLILQGSGGNGKNSMMEVILDVLGVDEYAKTCEIEVLLHQDRRSSSGPSPEFAELRGVRMLMPEEPAAGSRLSGSMIKTWTGSAVKKARKLNQAPFSFPPLAKISLGVNPKPSLAEKDGGIRRRVFVCRFTQKFRPKAPSGDGRKFIDKFLDERSGVLNWLLDGLKDYFIQGLNHPPIVLEETAEYFDEQDQIGGFVKHFCIAEEGAKITAKDIYDEYKNQCSNNAEDAKTQNAFGKALTELGFPVEKRGGKKYRIGLRLRLPGEFD